MGLYPDKGVVVMERNSSTLRVFTPLALLLALAAAPLSSPTAALAATCGDSVVEGDEECEADSTSACSVGQCSGGTNNKGICSSDTDCPSSSCVMLCNSDCSCVAPGCGDVNGDGAFKVTDALMALKSAVKIGKCIGGTSDGSSCTTGSSSGCPSGVCSSLCQDIRCDVDGTKTSSSTSSTYVKTTDALFLLKKAVGISVDLTCPGVEIANVTDLPSATDPVTSEGLDLKQTLQSALSARESDTSTTATKIDLSANASFFEEIAGDSHKDVSIGACETVNRYRNALEWAAEGDKVLCYLSNIVGTQAPRACSSAGTTCTSDSDCTGTDETCDPTVDIYDGSAHIIDLALEHPGFCAGLAMMFDVDEIDTLDIDATCRADSDCGSRCSDNGATCTDDSGCNTGATCTTTSPCISFDQESGADNIRVRIQAERAGGSTGDTLSSFAMQACEDIDGGTYSVPLVVYDEVTLGSLQLGVDYSSATGSFDGDG
ncbi:MAG: hypothetical protein VCB80_00455, partial [Deltaproteobacteria bacterium]